MLALSRKKNEALVINNNVEITVLEIKGEQVKLGISAPREVPVYRKEVYVQIQDANQESVDTYVYFMNDNLFKGIDIKPENTNLPNGKAADMQKACEEYTALLNSMPQDIQLLGIGANGHIGFNEPNTPFDSTTHIVKLEEGTRRDNARFFASLDEVPTHAITMGIANIMNAKKILVVANGANKAQAVYQMIKGEVSENCPASILQKHNDVVVVVDEAAYSLCK